MRDAHCRLGEGIVGLQRQGVRKDTYPPSRPSDDLILAYHQSTGLPAYWPAGLPVACRLSPVASAVSATNGMSCPLLCSSLPLWAAAVSGPDPGRASPGLSLSSFVQIRSQRGSHAGGHWQSNTTPLTHPDAIAITGAPFVTKPSSLVCPCARLHACARSIRGRGTASLPTAATATLGMLSCKLPDQTCQIIAKWLMPPAQKPQLSYLITDAPVGARACSDMVNPASIGGLIPLLRLLFLRLIPPGFPAY